VTAFEFREARGEVVSVPEIAVYKNVGNVTYGLSLQSAVPLLAGIVDSTLANLLI
jgi:hypothetical protein